MIIMLIGLTGTNGAGKGEVAKYLKKKGFIYFSLSDILREELNKKGLEISRENLQNVGNQLRKKFGPGVLAEKTIKKIKDKSIIDSIRNPEEIRRLREFAKEFKTVFFLLSVDAPIKLRFERLGKRGRMESADTLEEFKEREQFEKGKETHGQQINVCMEMADYTVINDGTLEELYDKIDKALKNRGNL